MNLIILTLYKMLWYLIHYLYTILQFIYTVYKYIIAKKDDINFKFNIKRSDLENIYIRTSKLQNIPKHVTILLGDEDPSYKDLANLIVWSMECGISYITFYDIEGKLKKTESEIRCNVEKKLQNGYHVIWHSNGYKNGFTGKKIHVKMLCRLDGRQKIVETSKVMVKRKTQDVTIKNVDIELKSCYNYPDPYLGIYCGTYLNTNGYPPWEIRLTEFIPLKTHHNITSNNFISVLERYNKCEQRVGK